ncbi:MAG: hypothetical protein WCA08_15020, partial [Desulfoferrobacter sp.]
MTAFILICSVATSLSSPASADIKSAVAAYKNGNYELAFEELSRLSERGNSVAQRLLGNMYQGGLGVVKNHGLAFEFYLRAAQQGDPLAQFMV